MINMDDIMIDLETLGTDPNTPVLSIGAVYFDLKTKQLGPTFYMALDVNEQIARGRKPTGDTIKWWIQQSADAKKVFAEATKPAKEVLEIFARWMLINNKDAYVWGNGSTFDISIMEDLFKDYGLTRPWKYNRVMDMRTFKRFNNKGVMTKSIGVAHNALDDAKFQAQWVMDNS